MKRHLLFLLIALLFLNFGPGVPMSASTPTANAAPPPPATPEETEVESAIRRAIRGQEAGALAYLIYETQIEDVQISRDNKLAVSYLVPVDSQTGEVVPTEPGLVPVLKEGDAWQAVLPGDERWTEAVRSLPDELISEEIRAFYLALEAETAQLAPDGPLTGYLLPWAGGKSLVMTRSLAHDADIKSGNAHFSFDFSTSPSQLFELYAAKAGTVYSFRDSCTNGDPSCSNWIVLQDITTDPVTYQLYLHLAQGSIPSALKTVGVPVTRGQFIGVADDTGASTNHHLHFQVETAPYDYLGFWGVSVDIVFEDVFINGGRPRIPADLPYCLSTDVCDDTQYLYLSQNYPNGDRWPPTGGIASPVNSATVTAPTLTLSGWAQDAISGMGIAQFIANYDGAWREVGEPLVEMTEFSTTWDLCADEVPRGPVSLALRLRDSVGNYTLDLAGLRHFNMAYECPVEPPPACVPDADQIALFSKPDFEGECTKFGTGTFYKIDPEVNDVGPDEAASILVGEDVWATFYTETWYNGRGQTLTTSAANLADHPIGSGTISSLIVRASDQPPAAPKPAFPADDASTSTGKYVVLAWRDGGGALEYQVELNGPGGLRTSPWRSAPGWAVGQLAAGDYTWRVRARNDNGTGAWSATRDLEMYTTTLAAQDTSPHTAPYGSDFETAAGYEDWDNTNNWDLTNLLNHSTTTEAALSYAYDVDALNGYDNGVPTGGDLTSPPITIPSAGFSLRFWYLYETEGPGPYWDQRWVQISTDGQAFTDLFQLRDDVLNQWLQFTYDLSEYAGETVWIRFHFETVDAGLNAFKGWFIDDFSIDQDAAPPECNRDGNDTPLTATKLAVGGQAQAVLCPNGDVDYYQFDAKQGDRIGAAALAQELGSPLDTTLTLLDGDGISALADNDDRVLYEQTDSLLAYRIRRNGTYYLKLRAWDHPMSGGDEYTYTLRLVDDRTLPAAALEYPRTGLVLPRTPITLRVDAGDGSGTGISHVEFLWHSGDWLDGEWQEAGQDWDGSDGWSLVFDASALSRQMGVAFYARVYDWAGNWTGLGAWNLSLYEGAAYLPLLRR